MREIMLKEPVELTLPAQQNMMLVLRLTTAGVIARAGLTVDRINDVKLAVEEACSCLLDAKPAPQRLKLAFTEDEKGLKISVCGGMGCDCSAVNEDELTVVKCILDSLVDDVQVCMNGSAIGGIEMRVALDC